MVLERFKREYEQAENVTDRSHFLLQRQALAELIRLAEHGAVMQWIPVSERLPECVDENEYTGKWSNEVQFFVARNNEIYIGYLSEKYSEWVNKEETRTFELTEVTHWMPLPQPPKEG